MTWFTRQHFSRCLSLQHRRHTCELDHPPAHLHADPLVVLACGHAFTTSTLDGVLELGQAYQAAPASSDTALPQWMRPLPLPSAVAKPSACPHCKRQVQGVKRYGQVTKKQVGCGLSSEAGNEASES